MTSKLVRRRQGLLAIITEGLNRACNMSRYIIYKLRKEDDLVIDKLAKYYGVNKADAIRIAVFEKARALGLVTG